MRVSTSDFAAGGNAANQGCEAVGEGKKGAKPLRISESAEAISQVFEFPFFSS